MWKSQGVGGNLKLILGYFFLFLIIIFVDLIRTTYQGISNESHSLCFHADFTDIKNNLKTYLIWQYAL